MSQLQERLRALPTSVLTGMRRGIEKESLRARPDAGLALTPHPAALGSALTHPNITTDFSESQLESFQVFAGSYFDRAWIFFGYDFYEFYDLEYRLFSFREDKAGDGLCSIISFDSYCFNADLRRL